MARRAFGLEFKVSLLPCSAVVSCGLLCGLLAVRTTLDLLSCDRSEFVKFMFVICIIYQIFAEITACRIPSLTHLLLSTKEKKNIIKKQLTFVY